MDRTIFHWYVIQGNEKNVVVCSWLKSDINNTLCVISMESCLFLQPLPLVDKLYHGVKNVPPAGETVEYYVVQVCVCYKRTHPIPSQANNFTSLFSPPRIITPKLMKVAQNVYLMKHCLVYNLPQIKNHRNKHTILY